MWVCHSVFLKKTFAIYSNGFSISHKCQSQTSLRITTTAQCRSKPFQPGEAKEKPSITTSFCILAAFRKKCHNSKLDTYYLLGLINTIVFILFYIMSQIYLSDYIQMYLENKDDKTIRHLSILFSACHSFSLI